MGDEQRSEILAQASALQRMATMEMLPPVDESAAQEFARLMDRKQNGQHAKSQETDQKGRNWQRFKLNAFRFAGRLLAGDPRLIARRQEEKQRRQAAFGAPGADDQSRTGKRGRSLLLRLGASLFRDPVASDLAHELAECVRHADVFGSSWQLDILLSSPELAQTLLRMRCDDAVLQLQFTCPDPQSRAILENNRMTLLTRLGAAGSRPVVVTIDAGAIDGDAFAVQHAGGSA